MAALFAVMGALGAIAPAAASGAATGSADSCAGAQVLLLRLC